MTKAQDFDIVGSYDAERYQPLNAERSVNLFEYSDVSGKKPKSLFPTSGLVDTELAFTGTTGGCRASFTFRGDAYQVIGADVYWITGTGVTLTETKLTGTLNTTDTFVGVDANTFQIILVDGQDGWIIDTTPTPSNPPTLTRITSPSFPSAPLDVCYLDGFFTVIRGGTNAFRLSAFEQGMMWGPEPKTFTADAGTDLLTVSSTAAFQTGVTVRVTNSGGGLPAPLSVNTNYYCIQVSATTLRLATSYANALANSFIDITTAGTGTHTITVFAQLQEAQVTSHPGTLVACRTLHRRLFLFSQNFTEVWENAGIGYNLPFRRNNSLLMEVGCAAIGSVATGFDRMFFLAQDRDGLAGVMMATGTQAVKVSNKALDFQLAQYAEDPALSGSGTTGVSDARAVMIKENGLIFYRLNFTLANHTYVYGVTNSEGTENNKWHEEEVLNGDRHPAQTHFYLNGNNYYGSYNEPIVYRVDDTVSTNAGEKIRRMRISRQFTPPGYQRIRIDRLQVDLLQGSADAGFTNPKVYLSVSRDGGVSYGNSLLGSMGAIGERTYRTLWRKLGTTRRGQGVVFKIEFFNDSPFVVLGASWNVETLPE